MTLFPELSPASLAQATLDFRSAKSLMQQRLYTWAKGLEEQFPVTFAEGEISVAGIVVNYASDSPDSATIQERKRKLLSQGVELYFVYPWELKSVELILSHFQSRLGLDQRKFAAKRLRLEHVPQKEADIFMRSNHIQGSANGSQKVNYGLRHKDTGELLAVQQYCKSRWMLKKIDENPGIWEGLRLASKRNVQIYGAATRLQKAFLEEYHPTELMSYVDYSHSLGAYKEIQGFQSTVTAQESYMWCLTKEPTSVTIVDKLGVERFPNLELVKKTPYLNPSKMAGAFGRGVGQTFYGGKLGSRKQLLERGNELYHNDLILEAIGYDKIYTAGQLKWSKKFPQNSDVAEN